MDIDLMTLCCLHFGCKASALLAILILRFH